MTIGLAIVFIACARLLVATGQATYDAVLDEDAASLAVAGLASVGLIALVASALLIPAFWLGVYDWMVAHSFHGLR